MKRMKLFIVIIVMISFLLIFSIPTALSSALIAEPSPTTENQQGIFDEITQAILEAIASDTNYVQKGMVANLQVSDVKTTSDQKWATAWLVYYDYQIEALIPSEPGLAISKYVDNDWQVYLPTDPGWLEAVNSTPDELLSNSQKDMWVAMKQGEPESLTTQSGYSLPWHGGDTVSLSRSVGHDADYTTAHFAFDFYIPGTTICPTAGKSVESPKGLNFNLLASKAGTVWGWDDSVDNCNHSLVNFIVLRNSDDPTLFQLYLHLAKDSIPEELKTVGAPVARGQFIGVADNTGNSTGSHLHFQVEHQPYWPASNPYWNTALDITFDEVDINGGRPRSSYLDAPYCRDSDICDDFRQTYVSNNYYLGDSVPPTGELSGVKNGDVVETDTIILSGSGSDEQTGLDYGQLIAYFNDTWNAVGPQFNPGFTYTWNLCDPGMPVPNGPISVALLLVDIAGNPAPRVGLRHFTKNYSCPIPPPSCIPGASQISLFEDPYYMGGCVKFDIGNYPTAVSLNPIGNDDVESILVGSNVIATLYSEENYTGHSQAITENVGYLQYAWVPSNSLSSLKVSQKASLPSAPILINPIASAIFRQGDVIPLSWLNGGGALEFQAEIFLSSNLFRTIPWQNYPVAYVDSLSQGSYTWRVQGRNSAGVGPWSQSMAFSIESPIVIPSAETVPYSDTMETTQAKWSRDPTLWTYISNSSMAHSGTHSWWYQNTYGNYDNTYPNWGSLTSPPISIPGSGYYLRFYYRYQTETQGSTWDQRWVQISVDGGPFVNLVQIYNDIQMQETSSWLRNKAIDLSAYAGRTIRVRFQFSTLDAAANNFSGWGIDDFSITTSPPPSCSDSRADDTPAQAFLLTYDPSITIPGDICPNGDFDYYKFYGNEGDRIVADIDAKINNSLLDSYLYLLSDDGKTVLAENDDEVYAQRRDPLISYTLPKSGIYYLQLRAWKHPLLGGDNYFYTIRLYEDHTNPSAMITWPPSDIYLPDAKMTLTTSVSDVTNGVNRVDFYWYSNDWLSGAWEKLGTDWDPADGWSLLFDPAGQIEGNEAALFIKAYDMAGNWAGVAAWDLGIDKAAPVTAMKPLDLIQSSNAILLEWTVSDNLSGIDYVEIKEKINDGAWTTSPPIYTTRPRHWIIEEPGNTYSFLMHGVDHSGNSEIYPSSAETSTAIPDEAVLCFAPDSYDTSGNDNTFTNASQIYVNEASQIHNYCNPLSADKKDDVDWIKVNVTQGTRYLIQSIPNSPQTATIISLFAQNGTTLLAESTPLNFGDISNLLWTSASNQTVYIRLRHLDGRVIGNDVSNTISVRTATWTYFPIMDH